jgi:hypothetical protein
MYLWRTPTRASDFGVLGFPIGRGCEGGGQSARPSPGPSFQPIAAGEQARKPLRPCAGQWKTALQPAATLCNARPGCEWPGAALSNHPLLRACLSATFSRYPGWPPVSDARGGGTRPDPRTPSVFQFHVPHHGATVTAYRVDAPISDASLPFPSLPARSQLAINALEIPRGGPAHPSADAHTVHSTESRVRHRVHSYLPTYMHHPASASIPTCSPSEDADARLVATPDAHCSPRLMPD